MPTPRCVTKMTVNSNLSKAQHSNSLVIIFVQTSNDSLSICLGPVFIYRLCSGQRLRTSLTKIDNFEEPFFEVSGRPETSVRGLQIQGFGFKIIKFQQIRRRVALLWPPAPGGEGARGLTLGTGTCHWHLPLTLVRHTLEGKLRQPEHSHMTRRAEKLVIFFSKL